MAQIIVLDGPEKSGKTTLARLLVSKYGCRYRHFTAEPEAGWLYDHTFAEAIQDAERHPELVTVWDRSWASEIVYGTFFGRRRRLVEQPDLGEMLYGEPIAAKGGIRVMMLGPGSHAMELLRTADDHPIPVQQERLWFRQYGHRQGWELVVESEHNDQWQSYFADKLWQLARSSRVVTRGEVPV